MRTTITLDAESKAPVERAMKEQRRSFEAVVTEAVKRGLGPDLRPAEVDLPVHSTGRALVNLDKATRLAGELEDEEIIQKMALGR